MADKITVEQILAQMQEWHIEATTFRNDGWSQAGYQEKLNALHARITAIMDNVHLINPLTEEQKEQVEEGRYDYDEVSFRPDPRNYED